MTRRIVDGPRWEAIKANNWPVVDSATAGMTVPSEAEWALMQPGCWAKQFSDSLVTMS